MNGKAATRSTHGSPEPGRHRRVLPTLAQLFWGGLFAIHVPAFWAVWSSLISDGLDLSRLGSGIALALAMAFFVLKFRDLAILRLRTRQQSVIVVCLLTAIVHHQAIAPGGEGALAVPAAVATIGAVGEFARLRPPAPRRLLQHLAAQLAARRLILATAFRCDDDVRTTATDKPRSTSDPRGPPA
ncbi:MAG: hypothetical protein ACYTGF_09105 [Planctomycetota bacterium]|jgi:hypothetical protein